MARKPLPHFQQFSNVDEVFDKLLELGFFVNEAHKNEQLEQLKNPTPGPFDSNEFWFSNGAAELKIFRNLFGAYELCNYRSLRHPALDELWAVAKLSKA